jgi:hypothetical protein
MSAIFAPKLGKSEQKKELPIREFFDVKVNIVK